jgi:hypothetical protein
MGCDGLAHFRFWFWFLHFIVLFPFVLLCCLFCSFPGGSIALSEPVYVTARLQCGNGWGPRNTVLVNVLPASGNSTCVMCKNVIFTEFSYHPDKNDSHFIELKNIGQTPIVMTGATIKGTVFF